MLDRSREFIELAKCLNFTSAAKRLHLSVSALSRHMADLEAEIGVALFSRSPLDLTPAGQDYLESISGIIEQFDDAIEHCRKVERENSRPFCVYMLPGETTFHRVMYEAVASLRQDFPGLSTSICVDDAHFTAEEALMDKKADIGVMYRWFANDASQIAREVLCVLPLCIWVLESSPLAVHESITFDDLTNYVYPYSTNRQSFGATDSVKRHFCEKEVILRTRLKVLRNRSDFYISLRDDEFMVDFEGDASPLLFNPNLKCIPFDPPSPTPVHLAFLKDNDSPILKRFVELCHELAQEKGLPQSV